jgi:hypothetical protein
MKKIKVVLSFAAAFLMLMGINADTVSADAIGSRERYGRP